MLAYTASNELPARVHCALELLLQILLHDLSCNACCTLLWEVSGLLHFVILPTLCHEAYAPVHRDHTMSVLFAVHYMDMHAM